MITAGPFLGALGSAPLTTTGSITAATATIDGQPVGQPAAQTPSYTLINGTGSVATFTTPNDGREHAYTVAMSVNVTSAETGGAFQVAYTSRGQPLTAALDAGAHGLGTFASSALICADANTIVTVSQSSALTVGAATAAVAVSGA